MTDGVVNAPKQMSQEAKDKQALSMKERWQDPAYREAVAAGRANAKAKKAAEPVGTPADAGVDAGAVNPAE